MNISLPDPLHAVAEDLAARAGFKTTDEYIADLVRRDLEQQQQKDPDYYLRRAMAEGGDPATVTPEALAKRKREIEALLIEGLNSGPAVPLTPDLWQAIRREAQERRERRNQQT
jgi:Arc/MetJ-type ribon-helix-helix transcriptional regulator